MGRSTNRDKRQPSNPTRSRPSAGPRRQLSLVKKTVFALAATAVFFVGLELALAALGVRPAFYDEDPYVGFSSYIPLFVPRAGANGQREMVTADSKLKWFNPQRFAKDKPPGTYRIFCVGGSTTYGRPYDDATSFCGWLRELLAAADHSHPWEVINAGGISYASYRVAMLMEELAGYDPDLFIIYTGHNEFLEGRTYRTLKDLPSPVRGLGGLLSHTRTYTAIKHLVAERAKSAPAPDQQRELLPAEVKTLLDGGVGPDAYHRDDPWRQQVLQHYRLNLNRMIDIARSAGARVVLVTPASNLRDCSPFKSQHRDGLDDADLRRWQSLIDGGLQARDAGQFDRALDLMDQALAVDDRFAMSFYRRGKTLIQLQRFDEAKTALMRARDEDICPLRALTPVRQIVSEAAGRHRAALIDFVALVDDQSEHAIPGNNLFLDHVHPTLEGNRLLALALFDELTRVRIVRPDNAWGGNKIAEVTRLVEGRVDRKKQGIALRNLAKVLAWAGKVDEANRLALRASQLVAGDANAYYLAGNALIAQGKLQPAVAQYKQALKINPDYVEVHNSLGAAYQMMGRVDAAVAQYREAIRIQPTFAPAHCNLGAALDRQGETEPAVAEYREAIRLNPHYSKARNNLGALLRKQGRLQPAADELEAALRDNPRLAEAHYNLGLVRAQQGNHQMARDHFDQALRIRPDYRPAHVALARLLYRQGDSRGAVTHLRQALRKKPPSIEAASVLAWILATSEDATLRDGNEALRWAQYCVQATAAREPVLLNTLAAAYAERGDFQAAVRWQRQAADRAPASLKKAYLARLQLYQANRPFRQGINRPE